MDITADQIKAAREEVCCHILNHFLFDKVWNEVDSEYRVNIKPILMNKHSVVGSFGLHKKEYTRKRISSNCQRNMRRGQS